MRHAVHRSLQSSMKACGSGFPLSPGTSTPLQHTTQQQSSAETMETAWQLTASDKDSTAPSHEDGRDGEDVDSG